MKYLDKKNKEIVPLVTKIKEEKKIFKKQLKNLKMMKTANLIIY